MNKKNIEKEAPKYTSRLIVRLTPQLHKEIAEYAALAGPPSMLIISVLRNMRAKMRAK